MSFFQKNIFSQKVKKISIIVNKTSYKKKTSVSTIFFSIKIIKSSKGANKYLLRECNLKSLISYTFPSFNDKKKNLKYNT